MSKLNQLSAKGAKCNSLGQRPRYEPLKIPSAESAKCVGRNIITNVFIDRFLFRAFSASKTHRTHPRALPWAITFRAFGAGTQSFDTDSYAVGYRYAVGFADCLSLISQVIKSTANAKI